jgi:hypothetical protein
MAQSSHSGSDKLAKAELIALVRKLMSAEGSEGEFVRWLDILKANFEHPAPADLIYWPNQVPGFNSSDPSPEEIVEFGLAYKRRILPREDLARLVHAFMHPKQPSDDDQAAYYLISENLRGFEINHLCMWARLRGISAQELVEKVQNDQVLSDPGFQRSLAETYTDRCG